MRKRTRLLISMPVLFIMIGAIFLAAKPELSSAQDDGFKMYQLLVFCGDSGLASAIFGHVVTEGGTVGRPLMGTKSICVGKCGGDGTVSLTDALAGLPAAVSAGLQAKVDKHQADAAAGKGWPLTCLGDGKEKPPPEKKCEKPTPWFGGSGGSSNCKEVQSPVVRENAGAVTVVICGYPVFRGVPEDNSPLFMEAYRAVVRDHVMAQVGSKVCCDKFREAARTGTPCYPGADIDCDGIPNLSDVSSAGGYPLPAINNLFSTPEGAPIDPFPAGLNPDDPGFLPPQDKCDCKWELKKGTLNCSPDGKQPHYYQAWWRCPSTGNERFTRKSAPATAPCTPPQRSGQ